MMRTRIVRIGNSRGIRLPKVVLEEAQLTDEVELRTERGRIVICAANKPRAGWAEAARRMRARGEDQLVDSPVSTRFDREEWEWR